MARRLPNDPAGRPTPVVVLLALALAAGCGDDGATGGPDVQSVDDTGPGLVDDGGDTTADVPAGTPVWHGDVEAIVMEHCASCHLDGGIGPFPLVDYRSASTLARSALAAMEAGIMPPWPPDPGCNRYERERLVPAESIARFRAWVEADMPRGNPADGLPLPEPPTTEAPDIVARPSAPYTASTTDDDDYRCFLLDATFEQDTYATQIWVEPGFAPVVHHVLVYRVDPERVAEMDALDGADGAPGFECFGGELGGPIGWYVPGTEPRTYDGGDALLLPQGSRLLMQVHYHTSVTAPQPDVTTLNLMTTEHAPDNTFQTIGFPNGGIVILPGDAESTHVAEQENTTPFPLVVREVAGHMHLLGTRIAVEVVRADGSTECLLDIPDWDFEWQQFYTLREDIVVYPGDAVRMTCTYDNSAANQPVVDGERPEPRLVTWGEGTYDEMCLSYVTVVQPLDGVLASVCPDYEVCRAGCDDPDTYLCMMECSVGVAACGDCLVETFFGDDGCVRTACGLQAAAVSDCYTDCRIAVSTEGANLIECMGATCPAGLAALDACVTPRLADGTCDGAVAACRDF